MLVAAGVWSAGLDVETRIVFSMAAPLTCITLQGCDAASAKALPVLAHCASGVVCSVGVSGSAGFWDVDFHFTDVLSDRLDRRHGRVGGVLKVESHTDKVQIAADGALFFFFTCKHLGSAESTVERLSFEPLWYACEVSLLDPTARRHC